jgi:cysteine desulfurase/selenocysteine lyase
MNHAAKSSESPLPRADFPILETMVNGKPLVYLDNAATSQKPRAVLDAMTHFYEHDNANVHRGVHELSVRATTAYETARQTVQRSINAAQPQEVIFTRNATEALNLAANSLGVTLQPGDEVILSELEHHSNIVPWQVVAKWRGAKIIIWKLRADSEGIKKLHLDDLQKLLSTSKGKTKIVAVSHVSNVLGSVQPIAEIAKAAHKIGATVVVDGAQAVGHTKVDVQALDADIYVFSGHKVYGPTGIGVLYGKHALLKELMPYQTGGDMVASVSFAKTTYAELPARLEAGTPNVAGAVGLAAALTYVTTHDLNKVAQHEAALAQQARSKLATVPGLQLVEPAAPQSLTGIVSFVVEGVHPHDLGTLLDQEGVAIRTGLLCAEPLIRSLGYEAVCRASFAGYNTEAEVVVLVKAVEKAIKKLRPS